MLFFNSQLVQFVTWIAAAIRSLSLLLQVRTRSRCHALAERAAPVVAFATVLVMHKAAPALEVVAIRQR
jgi:hypothetical protein